MMDKDIKIPEKHYVGFSTRHKNSIPLGFITPDGDDKAAQQRKSTVDQWSKNSGIPSKVIENTPMVGFKLANAIRRGDSWGSGNVVWRIEDPRGFELEISSSNLSQIMLNCTIENGEILAPCVWGRLKAVNVLIPTNTDVYKNAITNTKRANKLTSLKDVKVGNKIVLQNGIEGIYLGLLYPLVKNSITVRTHKKMHFIFNEDNKVLHINSNIKVSEILVNSTLTEEECELTANNCIIDRDVTVSSQTYLTFIGAACDLPTFKFNIIKNTEPGYDKVSRNNSLLLFYNNLWLAFDDYNIRYSANGHVFDKDEFLKSGKVVYGMIESRGHYYSRVPKTVQLPDPANQTFYRPQIEVITQYSSYTLYT
jgi:hypothetical protein